MLDQAKPPVVPVDPALRAEVSRVLELNEQYLYQCFSGRRRTPPERCPAIERATGARITCEQLRPDVAWHRVPDPAWPNPLGRPCIDVAAPKEGERAA